MKLRNGRGWAYAGAWLGGALSIAGNVHNSFVPPDGAPADWAPMPGAVIVSAAWPIALVIVAEVVIRTPWPKAWYWICLRLIGLVPVGVVSGVVSFRHLRDLLAYFGEDRWIQNLGPIAVDGLMITCAAALFATAVHRTAASTDTDNVPLAVRLAGQFATVRELLSKSADKGTEIVDKTIGTADNPTLSVQLDKARLDRELDRLQREEDKLTADMDNGQPIDLDTLFPDGTDSETADSHWARRLEADKIIADTDSQEDRTPSVSLSMTERLSFLRQAFPDSIPTGSQVKAELGISSQGTVTALLNALKMERGIPITIRKRS